MIRYVFILGGIIGFGLSSPPLSAQSNEGKEFWFGFMEHRDVGEAAMVAMITSKENTSGEISVPGLNWSQSFNVTANLVTLVNLPRSVEHMGSEFVQGKGIHIEMEAPSSVYIHQYFGMRSEATVVLPVESLGQEYYVMAYSGINLGGTEYPSEFLVVASEDSTLIQINLSTASKGRNLSLSPFEVLLNKGQSYQVQAARADADLTGSRLSANKDFALLAGTSWTQVPSFCQFRDNLLEQMFPVNTWGKSFVTVPFIHNPYDIIRVIASENNTAVSVKTDRGENEFVLNQGEYREFNQILPSFIEANNPILVAQYMIGTECSSHPIGDPAMVLLNSIEQTRQQLTFFNSSFQAITENYVNITTKTEDRERVVLDGSPLASFGSSFQVLDANPEYSYARVQVSPGSHTLESDRCGISAIVYGYGNVESYAYNGGANFISLDNLLPPFDACAGDPFSVNLDITQDRYAYAWDFGDGFQSNEALPQHVYDSPGDYLLSLSLTDECLNSQSLWESPVTVIEKESLVADSSQLLCQGDSLQLEVSGGESVVSYTWRGPENFSVDTSTVLLTQVQPAMSGTYTVIGQTADCPTLPTQTEVTIIPTPQPDLGVDTFFCPPKGELLNISPGIFAAYQWEDFSTQGDKEVNVAGPYIVEVRDEFGCIATDTVLIEERCPAQLEMPNAFSPNGDQVNDQLVLTSEFVQQIDLQIFDRWGKVVFTTNDLQASWDGKIPNGNDAKAGVYFYSLKWEGYDEFGEYAVHPLSGNVLLVR